MSKYGTGWLPQLPDHRDFKLGVERPQELAAPLPDTIDLSTSIDWIYDQGQENSCTAHAAISIDRFYRKAKGLPVIEGSRNFHYWNTRNLEGTINSDAGAYVRDSMKVLNSIGIVPEVSWSYDSNTLYATPPKALYPTATANQLDTTAYMTVDQTRQALQSCLANGFPFIFGMEVFDAFESSAVASSGIVPMPTATDNVSGGHCIMAVGYDNSKQMYKIMNSWGPNWGQKGYFWLPYAFLESAELVNDIWTVRG